MYFLFILIILLFAVIFILKDPKERYLKHFSLLLSGLSIVLALLLLNSVHYDSGVTGFQFLGMFEVAVSAVSRWVQVLTAVALISLLLHFYTLTRVEA